MKNIAYIVMLVAVTFCYAEAPPNNHEEAAKMYLQAVSYMNGKTVAQDFNKAAELLEKSALDGFAPAQLLLGNLYLNGNGVTQSDYTADMWYKKSAENGSLQGMVNHASMLILGRGCSANLSEAKSWINKAAILGYSEAEKLLAVMPSLELENLKEFVYAMKLMREQVDSDSSDVMLDLLSSQINRVLNYAIHESCNDGPGRMLEKRHIMDRLKLFDEVRDSVYFLEGKLTARLGNQEHNLNDTMKRINALRDIKERLRTNRTNYLSYYVVLPYLKEANRLFSTAYRPFDKNLRPPIIEGVKLLAKALHKEWLVQCNQDVISYFTDVTAYLKDLVSESEFNDFKTRTTLWESNDPSKKLGADAWMP